MVLSLLIFFSTFFASAFFWPTWRLWRRCGLNALVLPYDDTAHGLVGRYFRATLLGIFVLLVALCLGLPERALGSLTWFQVPAVRIAGWGILIASLLWVVTAQAQMGASWRIGIDAGKKTPLVRNGVFAVIRHPIFLGMRMSLLGLFLVLPNALTLAILVVGEVLMQVQVRLEEDYLNAAHGSDYLDYCRTVRRWI